MTVENRVFKAHKENREFKVNKVRLVRKAHRDQKEIRAILVLKGLKVKRAL